ncbi:MAG TPA: adenylyltransferase/cytidyltransferase family protein [Gaiellaceae bacterium]|nr:adenylyltransferase/cytidyltransferase family protein [Gaiellaceae bacterium]
MTLVFGGTFDPPHVGHVALVEGAKRHFGVDRVLVLVVADPGHREVTASEDERLVLARAAFPAEDVELDDHPRTIDMLRARQLDDPVLLIGADEYVDFPGWKEPGAILELARVAVAARPGYELPEGVSSFDMTPTAVSSTEVRRRVAAGKPIDGLVPAAVAAEIERLGLYRDYTPG